MLFFSIKSHCFALLVFVALSSKILIAQSISNTASDLLNSVSKTQKFSLQKPFNDNRRKTWDRIPKVREGLKMDQLDKSQKQIFHTLLQQSLSPKGYLKVIAIMFNEDIQQKFEPNLGKNEYYIEIFGNPHADSLWAWQLEGHHLSLNITLMGDSIISHTPFLIGSNPQIVDSDDDRNGMCFIYAEEQKVANLVNTFTNNQKLKGYSATKQQPNNMYGEMYRDSLYSPYSGISSIVFTPKQKHILAEILKEYESYFFNITYDTTDNYNTETYFYFIGNTAYNGKHYYSIKNDKHFIECENYQNHSHHLWRTINDFAEKKTKKRK